MDTEEYYFTTDWFTYNIPIWERFFTDNHLYGKPNLKCLEIGCFEGRATLYLLNNVLTHESSSIDVIDTFQGSLDEYGMKELELNNILEVFKHNTRNYSDKIKIYHNDSRIVLRQLDRKPIYDIIYIDGSHKAHDLIEDVILCHPLLKQYGLLIFDDYLWQDNLSTTLPPKIAIDAFIKIYNQFYEILWSDYQVICKKKEPNHE